MWKLACAKLFHVLSSFTCLPLSAACFLFLGNNQPGERSTFFRESPAKIPTACSGYISGQLPFHLSPPAFETLRNNSLADTAVFPLLLNIYSCLSMKRYGNYCNFTHTPRHPHTSVRDAFTRRQHGLDGRAEGWWLWQLLRIAGSEPWAFKWSNFALVQHFPSWLRRKSPGKPNKLSRSWLYSLNTALRAGFPPGRWGSPGASHAAGSAKQLWSPQWCRATGRALLEPQWWVADQWSSATACISARQLLELHSAVLLQAALWSSTSICIAAVSSQKWHWSLSLWQLINEEEYNNHNVVFYRIWAFNPRTSKPFSDVH